MGSLMSQDVKLGKDLGNQDHLMKWNKETQSKFRKRMYENKRVPRSVLDP